MYSVKMRRLYIISIIMLVLFAATFLIMPVSNYISGTYSKIAYLIVGIVFWISGIGGYSILVYIYAIERKRRDKRRKNRFFFFSNLFTKVADISFLVGVILLIILLCTKLSTHYVVYINIFSIVLSFNAHWLFSRNLHIKILQNNRNGRKAK